MAKIFVCLFCAVAFIDAGAVIPEKYVIIYTPVVMRYVERSRIDIRQESSREEDIQDVIE